jgi:hypothetical protein
MTYSVTRSSTIAFGVVALMSFSTLPAAWADSSSEPAPTPMPAPTPPERPAERPAATSSAAQPSLNEPAPTPGWAEAGPGGTAGAPQPVARRYAHRNYAYGSGHRRYSNPFATAATGVAGGLADVGSIAAYPFYCFPNYGACSVRVPYRF